MNQEPCFVVVNGKILKISKNVILSDCFVSHKMEDDQEEQDRDTVGKMVNNSLRSTPLLVRIHFIVGLFSF